jgi:hypothetical protein
MSNPTGKGGFISGKSGNPGGRPRAVLSVQMVAREHTAAALRTLIDVMQRGKSDASRVAAANSLLDRGWGRPMQSVEIRALLAKKLSELTATELEALEANLAALPDDQSGTENRH